MQCDDLPDYATSPGVKESRELRHAKSMVHTYSTMKKIMP